MRFFVTMTIPDLDDDWRILGHTPPKKRRRREPVVPPIDAARGWIAGLGRNGHTLLTVLGGSPQARAGFYRELETRLVEVDAREPRAWLARGPFADFVDKVSRLSTALYTGPASSWQWLHALAFVDDLFIEGTVREMIDRPHFGREVYACYLLHDAVKLLMGARFLMREGASREAIAARVDLLVRWVTVPGALFSPADARAFREVGNVGHGPRVEGQVLDLLLLLLTIAMHNGAIDKVALVFDDLDAACSNEAHLQEMHQIVKATARWSTYTEIPIGLVIGVDPRNKANLRRAHRDLARDVLAGTTWPPV